MARPTLSFERPYPWEEKRGTTLERTIDVHKEAQRVYAQQKELLPTLQLEREPDPVAADHVRDVGRRTRILRDQEGPARLRSKATGSPKRTPTTSPIKRVVPSRYPETEDVVEEDPEALDGRIATMLMDQEWDTRTWTKPKIHAAIETLYGEIEMSPDPARRELATTMLIRLLEMHEDAVDFVETTLPTLCNKAFRTLVKNSDNQRTFRIAALLGVLSKWFARVLSVENAVGKSLGCLLRETELCARILQHHWRGVCFERSLHRREYDPSVRARIRSMHLIKFVELRHQFKVHRETVGPGGLPTNAIEAYVSIIHHLVQTRSSDIGEHHTLSDAPTSPTKVPNFVLGNQRKVISSGVLAFLASLVTASQCSHVTAMIISIVREIAFGQGPEKVIDILQSNIVERAVSEVQRLLKSSSFGDSDKTDQERMDASLDLINILSSQVLVGSREFSHSRGNQSTPVASLLGSNSSENAFLLEKLTSSATKFLLNDRVLDTLFQVLRASSLPPRQQEARCKKILRTLRLVACCSFGFPRVLSMLTQNGGRFMDLVLECFQDSRRAAAASAVSLFCEITDHPHGRQGLVTAGAVRSFMRWCRVGLGHAEGRDSFVMAMIGCSLLARQTLANEKVDQVWLLAAIKTPKGCLDASHKLLLNLVTFEGSGANCFAEKAATLFHSTGALPTLLKFLVQVTPTCMEPPFQSPNHRNISCIVLSRFFQVPEVARASFSEDTINHLALSLQCNRLDEIERAVARYSVEARLIHRLGSKEACKALTRLARCYAGVKNTTGVGDGAITACLRPSVTSSLVPELPQAMICDVMFRLHAIEDLVGYIKPVDYSADSPEVETALTDAAVELVGHLRPLPYGEAARSKFFRALGTHDHGKYATEKVMLLVELVAPAIMHVLREPSLHYELVETCCKALSRIACTNAACSMLLVQGCLQSALLHLPEMLFDAKRSCSPRKSEKVTEYAVDSVADEHGLLNVVPSLYTLLAKLCAVAEGRLALMRAQVLPRILKRLQLEDQLSPSKDIACKSEIAVILSRLAMVNTAEGNTGELFIHFGVLDVLVKLLRTHHPVEVIETKSIRKNEKLCCRSNRDSIEKTESSYSSKEVKKRLRVVDHVMTAIAALSQDLLKCVPKLVALGIIKLIYPLLDLVLPGKSSEEQSVRADAIRLHSMQVIHSIAAYPFGEYHSHLTRASISNSRAHRVITKNGVAEKTNALDSPMATLMEKVRRIGFDFAAELRSRDTVLTIEGKTVGDLAREILAAVNERTISRQRMEQRSQPVLSTLSPPPSYSPPPIHSPKLSTWKPSSDETISTLGPSFHHQSSQSPTSSPFPALSTHSVNPSSTIGSERKRSSRVQGDSSQSTTFEPQEIIEATRPLSLVVKIHSALPVTINGVDLASTRPPCKQELPSPTQKAQHSSPRYIFATPKTQKRASAPNAATSCLMLDPLFDSVASTQILFSPNHGKKRSLHHKDAEQGNADIEDEIQGYTFTQENDRFGHYVQIKGRRARRGDRFVPSLGLIEVDSVPVFVPFETYASKS